MTPQEIVLYAFIGGLLAFTAIILIGAALLLRWVRAATPDPNDPTRLPRRIPPARQPYANGTAEREQTR